MKIEPDKLDQPLYCCQAGDVCFQPTHPEDFYELPQDPVVELGFWELQSWLVSSELYQRCRLWGLGRVS